MFLESQLPKHQSLLCVSSPTPQGGTALFQESAKIQARVQSQLFFFWGGGVGVTLCCCVSTHFPGCIPLPSEARYSSLCPPRVPRVVFDNSCLLTTQESCGTIKRTNALSSDDQHGRRFALIQPCDWGWPKRGQASASNPRSFG